MSSFPSLSCTVLTPESGAEYEKALERNSPLSVLRPKYVVQPHGCDDITPVIAWAKSQTPPMEIAIKGGGAHSSTWSSSEGGIVIDLSAKMRGVGVSEEENIVYLQGGANWGDVYEACSKSNVDVVGGPLWFVGAGGFLLGGGYGPLSAQYGLGVDNITSVRVVLADGRSITATADNEPDLFWAIRGGGSQFGIVVEIGLRAFPSVGPITAGIIAYPGNEIANVLQLVKDFQATQTPLEKLTLSFARPAPHFKPSAVIMPWVCKDEGSARSQKVLSPFRDSNVKPVVDRCALLPDMLAISHSADAALAAAPKRVTIRGALIADFYPEMILEVWKQWVEFTESEDTKGSGIMWDLTSPAKLTEVSPSDTAVPIRDPNYWVAVQGRTNNPDADQKIKDFVARTVTYIREKNTKESGKDFGVFLSMAQGDEKPEDVFGVNLPRLRQLKAKYDPDVLWKKGVVIPPA